jgi:hypothetical protein
MVASSPIALGSKVGSPSPPYLAFPVEISLERLSMFSMSLLRSGLGRRFGGLGVPEVSRSMEPTQSEFSLVLSERYLAGRSPAASQVHESKGGGAQQEA